MICTRCGRAIVTGKRHARTDTGCIEIADFEVGAAVERGAARMASMHGRVPVDVYAATFDAIVEVLAVNPVAFARDVMAARLQRAEAGGAEVTYVG
jgi:hypothetical protein